MTTTTKEVEVIEQIFNPERIAEKDRMAQVAQARKWFGDWCTEASVELESFSDFLRRDDATDEEFMDRIRMLGIIGLMSFLETTRSGREPNLDDLREAMTGVR